MRFFISATALLLFVLGCSQCAHQQPAPAPYQEPGFLTSTSTSAGNPPLRWEKGSAPFVLVLSPEVEPWWPEIKTAAMYWNNVLQEQVFVFNVSQEELLFDFDSINFIVIRGGPAGENPVTQVGYMPNTGQIVQAPIFLPPDVSHALRFRVVVHELGHALGLAHDPMDENSVMHPRALFGPFEVTERDRKILKEWYFTPESAE